MLEEEVHLNTYPADILDDMTLLHVLRIASKAIEDIMVIQTADMRDLRESLSDRRLIKVGRVVVEVGMCDILIHLGSPLCVLPVFFAAHLRPLSESRDIFPQPVCIDLAAQAELSVKPTTLLVFEKDILPHRSNAAKLRTIVGTDVDSKVVTRMCDEPPALLTTGRYQEFVASTAEV
jgi:hypothetical protein